MRRCLQLAALGKGFAAPNPMVGAVLVHQGRIISEGYHALYGEAHGEASCLNNLKPEDRHLLPECTLYVNLEPCAHYGKTPPCALRIIQEGIKHVVVGNNDPFSEVNGRGFQLLEDHGVQYISGILEQEGSWLNRRFLSFHQKQRPYVILKWAETQQGYFAPLNRSRYQMSNKHSQQLVHKWRTEESAILVGWQTAMTDDPQLTARLWKGRQPLRLVFDRDATLPRTLRLFNEEAATWVINRQHEREEGHIRYIRLDFSQDILPQLMVRLHEASVLSLMVEGGARLLHTFIEEGFWDEARVFRTPDLLEQGIHAPALTHAQPILSTPLDTDMLHVYINRQLPYAYADTMEL